MASEIKTFRMSAMTIGACADFHRNVNELMVEYTPAALHVETEFVAHEAALNRLKSIVNRQRKLASTTYLKEKDQLRDRPIGVINGVIPCYLNTTVAAKRDAAIRMSAKLSAYKGIQRHEYRKQNMELDGMLAVLTDPENAADLELLGLTEEKDILVTAHAEFMEAYRGKTDELAEMADVKDTDSDEAMDAANAIYEKICKKMNAYALIQPTEEVNEFIFRLNGVVDAFSDFGGGSGGSSSEDGTEEGGTEGDTTPDEGTTPEDGEGSSEGGETPDPETPEGGGSSDGGGGDDDEEVVG